MGSGWPGPLQPSPDALALSLLHSSPQLLVGTPQGLTLLGALTQTAPQLTGLLAMGLTALLAVPDLALSLQQLPPQPITGVLQQAQLSPQLFCLWVQNGVRALRLRPWQEWACMPLPWLATGYHGPNTAP